MSDNWLPLSVRSGHSSRFTAPDKTVPSWIHGDVLDWLEKQLHAIVEHVVDVFEDEADELRVIRQIGREIRTDIGESVRDAIYDADESDDLLLDLVDYCLAYGSPRLDRDKDAQHLETLLKHGCLLTPLKVADSHWMLVERIEPAAIKSAEIAIRDAGTVAGAHLAKAWEAAYGRHASPTEAYEQSVKAVEAASLPIFAQRDSKGTLGKVIKNILDKPDKWQSKITSDDPLAQLAATMQLLWQGHPRHGKSDAIADASTLQAEAAVHLATTLVRLLSSGIFTLAQVPE